MGLDGVFKITVGFGVVLQALDEVVHLALKGMMGHVAGVRANAGDFEWRTTSEGLTWCLGGSNRIRSITERNGLEERLVKQR